MVHGGPQVFKMHFAMHFANHKWQAVSNVLLAQRAASSLVRSKTKRLEASDVGSFQKQTVVIAQGAEVDAEEVCITFVQIASAVRVSPEELLHAA